MAKETCIFPSVSFYQSKIQLHAYRVVDYRQCPPLFIFNFNILIFIYTIFFLYVYRLECFKERSKNIVQLQPTMIRVQPESWLTSDWK